MSRVAVFFLIVGIQVVVGTPGVDINEGGGFDFILEKFQNSLFINISRNERDVVSLECFNAVERFRNAVSSSKDWSLKMIDSTSRFSAGFLSGRLHYFGAYDQCVGITEDRNCTLKRCDEPPIKGQYCSVLLSSQIPLGARYNVPAVKELFLFHMTFPFRIGVCLPSVCTPSDLFNMVNNTIKPGKTSGLNITVTACETNEKEPLSSKQIAVIVILAHLAFILVLGTCVDICLVLSGVKDSDGYLTGFKGPFKFILNVLSSLSVYSNGKKILSTRVNRDDLPALHGIRFLSMTWVILAHCYSYLSIANLGNLNEIWEISERFPFQVILNGTLSADSFFFLSGLLVSYFLLKEFKKTKGNISWCMHYFHRIWRLTPGYAFVISLTIILDRIGSGPIWNETIKPSAEACQEGWWTSLLYINNFVKTENICLGHTWYLSNDMQFYLVAPIFVYLLYRWKHLGHTFNFLVIVVSAITTGILIDKKNYPPTTVVSEHMVKSSGFRTNVYIKPYCRIAPYLIGILVGHILVYRRDFKISKGYQFLCWIASAGFCLSAVYGVYKWNNQSLTKLPESSVAALYGSTFRIAWTVGLAWVTLACLTGRGGFINTILSWSVFIPLARLTYMAYLIHPLIMATTNGLMRENQFLSHYSMVNYFFTHLVLSYGVAFIASLAFEAPFISLEQILFRRPKTNKGRDETAPPSYDHKHMELNDLPPYDGKDPELSDEEPPRNSGYSSPVRNYRKFSASPSGVYNKRRHSEAPPVILVNGQRRMSEMIPRVYDHDNRRASAITLDGYRNGAYEHDRRPSVGLRRY